MWDMCERWSTGSLYSSKKVSLSIFQASAILLGPHLLVAPMPACSVDVKEGEEREDLQRC